MPNTGNLNSLAEKMRAKTEREREEREALTRQQFDALQRNLSELSKNALSTTEAAILRQLRNLERSVTLRCQMLSAAFGWKCLQALVLTLCILTGAGLGGWGLLTLTGNKVTALRQEIAELNNRKSALELTVSQLEAKTWGLTLVEGPEGRFIVLPLKRTLNPGWTIGKNPAWKVE